MSLVLTRSKPLRFGALTTLYFAQGVPIGLLSVAIPAWLAEQGTSSGTVSWFLGWVTLPWAFKLFAGPLMDRFGFPPMGFRRPWVLLAQGGLVASFLALAAVAALLPLDGVDATPPVESASGGMPSPRCCTWMVWATDPLKMLMVAGFVVNVFAASQDVAVDGLAIDVLPVNERGRANAFMACGQVLGYSAYGYVCALLLTRFGLAATALGCALTVLAIFLFAAAVRERAGERLLPWTAGKAAVRAEKVATTLRNSGRDLVRVLVLPMSLLLVAVEFVNRVRDGVARAVFPAFAVSLGYSAEQYALVSGWIGIAAAATGALLGPFIDAAGARRFLLGALLVSAACHLVAGFAPALWQNLDTLIPLALVSAIASQLVFVAIIALFMNLCWSKVAATQFAVYMSLANLSSSAGNMAFAKVSDHLSFAQDFLLMGALLLFAAALLRFFNAEAHAARLARLRTDGTAPTGGGRKRVGDYNGVYGDYHWEIAGRTLIVFSAKPRVGQLATFENVNAINSEQAQWSAQAKIDLNLAMLRRAEADKIAAQE